MSPFLRDLSSLLVIVAMALGTGRLAAGQIQPAPPGQNQPPAAPSPSVTPQPTPVAQAPAAKKPKAPKPLDACDIRNSGASVVATGALRAVAVLGVGETSREAGTSAVESKVCVNHFAAVDWYARFVTGPEVMRFSPEQKLRLAADNLINPFNLLTITGEAGISIAINSHTAYGPGFAGWGRNVGVAFTQDMTSQFFGTFLIPSITHTDPHYHRRPDMTMPRRILHCVDQIFWQRDDNGGHTLNYSEIFGPIVDMSLANLYVPGQQTHFAADAERYGVDLATAPIDNFITEFLPSLASRIHTHVVFVQRVVNEVATTGSVP